VTLVMQEPDWSTFWNVEWNQKRSFSLHLICEHNINYSYSAYFYYFSLISPYRISTGNFSKALFNVIGVFLPHTFRISMSSSYTLYLCTLSTVVRPHALHAHSSCSWFASVFIYFCLSWAFYAIRMKIKNFINGFV